MTRPLTTPVPLDERRLPEGQFDWARAALSECTAVVADLSAQERRICVHLWKHMAGQKALATAHHFSALKLNPTFTEATLLDLSGRGMLWFDNDLRAVLQCPPFSSLLTPHTVKVFGWERAFSASFIDLPISLLLYGPNTWLEASTACQRSGDMLTFRVKMREDLTLDIDAPDDADKWRIWIPLPLRQTEKVFIHLHSQRSRINAFHTLEDLNTHQQYSTNGIGMIYTLEQAIYLSSLFLHAYAALVG